MGAGVGQPPVAAITKHHKQSGLHNRDLSSILEAGRLGSGIGRAELPPEAPGATCCRWLLGSWQRHLRCHVEFFLCEGFQSSLFLEDTGHIGWSG